MLGTTKEYFDEMEKLKQYEALGTIEELSTRVKEEDILKDISYSLTTHLVLEKQKLDNKKYHAIYSDYMIAKHNIQTKNTDETLILLTKSQRLSSAPLIFCSA